MAKKTSTGSPTSGGNAENVHSEPGPNADPHEDVERFVSAAVRAFYDVYSYRHAAAILSTSYKTEMDEIEYALKQFKLTQMEIGMPGGNESGILKRISAAPKRLTPIVFA